MPMAEWEELAPLVPEVCDLSSVLSVRDFQALQALPPGLAVAVNADVLAASMAHAESSPDEIMGLLRGRVLHDVQTDRTVTLVLESQPLHAAQGSHTRVLASAESWHAAWPHMRDDLPIIGWYHSHPGFGIFFSGTDRQSQRNYLSQPWQVGLVVDPTSGEAGVFLGRECERVAMLVVGELFLAPKPSS